MATAICAKVGCNLPVFVEPRTRIAHKYCGRTHAQEVLGNNNLQPPHGQCAHCNLNGCTAKVAFDASTGRVHDFCCKDHADKAIKSGEWTKPRRYMDHDGDKKKSTGPKCRFPNCQLPVFTDPTTGRKHDYCGRSHAVEHRLMQTRVSHNSTAAASKVAAVDGNSLMAGLDACGSTNTEPDRVRRIGGFRAIPVSNSVLTSTPSATSLDERKPAAVSLPKCAICLAMNANIILIPCGHVCLCKDDADRLRRNQQLLNCPLCRQDISSTNEVFLNH